MLEQNFFDNTSCPPLIIECPDGLAWLQEKYLKKPSLKPVKRPERTIGKSRGVDLVKLKDALKAVPPDDDDLWVATATSLKYENIPFEVFDNWSSTSNKYIDTDDCLKKWNDIKPNGSRGLGSVFHNAEENGWVYKPSAESRQRAIVQAQENTGLILNKLQELSTVPASDSADSTLPVAYSQDQIAAMFTELYASTFKYVGERSQWFYNCGTHWRTERTGWVFDNIRKICRAIASDGGELTESQRRKFADASNVAGVERLVRVDRRHSATIDQWDSDPWLLNTPGGVVDLRTGKLQSHDADLYMSKIAGVTPMQMKTPVFDSFLSRVQPEAEMQKYLNRRAGYSLTGSTREQSFFFDYGTGANGKSIFQTIQLEILGTYAVTAPIELLTERKHDSHPTELARLHGARAVGLSETKSGRRWDESRIKVMTGGDKIVAHFMRQDFFEYIPEFKLFILGNHMPALKNVDEAISRRPQIVHWAVTIPENERDQKLLEKLKPEYPGILFKWVQGCLEWQRDGLNPPATVLATTKAYLDGEDSKGRWLEETIISRTGFTSNDALYSSWCLWCESQKEFPGTKIAFTKQLEERGFVRHTEKNQKGFMGILIEPVVNPAKPEVGKLIKKEHPRLSGPPEDVSTDSASAGEGDFEENIL